MTIKFMRGPLAHIPTLEDGQPYFAHDTRGFYVGWDGSNYLIAAGSTGSGAQPANTVNAGPTSGSDAFPAFRALVVADIPGLPWSKITSGKPTTLAGYGIVDAEPLGAAAAAVAAHEGAGDPHPQYTTAAEVTAYAQPLDSDLTAIAALTTAAFGRSLLTQATAGGTLTTLGLTANGQSLVTAANYAAMRALLDLEAGTDFYSVAAADAAFQPKDAELTALAGLTFAANQLVLLTGAGTATVGQLTAAYVADGAITYAKMQNVSATDKLLGRSTAGAGDVEEIACTAAGRALLDDADAAAQRATLGIATAGEGDNLLINGGFDFFQRQDPATDTSRADDAYGPDRWYVLTQTAAINVKRVAGNVSTNAVRLTQSQASAQRMGKAQIVESVNSFPLRSRTIRLQFNAKASTTTTLRYAILEWTGTADSVTSDVVLDWTSSAYTANNFFLAASLTVAAVGSTSVTTAWTACSTTATISASCNNLIVLVWTEGTAAQNVTVDLAEVQLVDGTASRAWLPRPIQQELSLCQRYYAKTYGPDIAPGNTTAAGSLSAVGYVSAAARPTWCWTMPVCMRIPPSVTYYAPVAGNAGSAYSYTAAAIFSVATQDSSQTSINLFNNAGAIAAGTYAEVHIVAEAEL